MIEVTVGEHKTQIGNDTVIAEHFEVDFGGDLLVLIENSEDGFKIINAMNGYGMNCQAKYENIKPIFQTL